jgi:hypothetical protein
MAPPTTNQVVKPDGTSYVDLNTPKGRKKSPDLKYNESERLKFKLPEQSAPVPKAVKTMREVVLAAEAARERKEEEKERKKKRWMVCAGDVGSDLE